jgi:hypothetical protein
VAAELSLSPQSKMFWSLLSKFKKGKVRKVQLGDKNLDWYYQNFLRKSYDYFYCGGALTSKD